MSDLRIFSYLPNPRIWKATIAARLNGVVLDIRGDEPPRLQGWLWDFEARPLTDEDRQSPDDLVQAARTGFKGRLFKTAAFLEAHPFGTVPAAFSPDGKVGIFESNSIARAVARLGESRYPLCGSDAYSSARVDSFLDASLIFARDAQIYLLSFRDNSTSIEIYRRAEAAFHTYMSGIDRALAGDQAFLVGTDISLADICFVAELTLFSRERAQSCVLAQLNLSPVMNADQLGPYARAMAHYERLCTHEAFAPDVGPYLEKLAQDIEADRRAHRAVAS